MGIKNVEDSFVLRLMKLNLGNTDQTTSAVEETTKVDRITQNCVNEVMYDSRYVFDEEKL